MASPIFFYTSGWEIGVGEYANGDLDKVVDDLNDNLKSIN
jgi:hypothetical protein